MTTFRITLSLALTLILCGFLCPPIGVIDDSVLTATGLLLAFATLDRLPLLLETFAKSGKTIHLRKGDLTISTSNDPVGESLPT